MYPLSIRELSLHLKEKKISSVELTQHYLTRIKQLNPTLNAFIHFDEEQALQAASEADSQRHKGLHQPLLGLPMAHKDLFCTKDMPTTCGSKMLEGYHSPFDATVVKKLQSQGCVLIGKTNMDEFAMGSTNEYSYFGPVKNPWNLNHVPGGSSGGSGAAVAANLVPFTTGSDTGGSIRQPAAFCGISGLKPTYGLISRFGMVAFASSLDQAGPMARNAEDLAYVLQALSGFDDCDSTSIDKETPDYLTHIAKPLKALRIGLPDDFFKPDVDETIQQAVLNAVHVLEALGAEIKPLTLSLIPHWAPCYYVIACAEASSNLARFDGIRFGHRTQSADTLQDLIARSRDEGFGMEVKRRILTGTYTLSSGYFDDYYVQAQKVRRMIQDELNEAYQNVDIIIGPTTTTTAFELGEKITNPTQRYLADMFTVAANLAGLPALSIPVGFKNDLPIGMQLMGPHFSEASLLNAAHVYQQNTDWHQQQPNHLEGYEL